MDGIVQILRSAIGLDPSSIGRGSIERAVRHRMEALGVPGVERYRERLAKEPQELGALIEEVVVPETWFFRDPGAFSGAARWVSRTVPSKRVRFLCVPCATGEEPFSLIMALLDAGVPPERFEVEAVDVSDRVLEHAAKGIYGRNSFRGGDLGFRERHFKKSAAGCLLDPSVRRLVNFRQANLLEDFASYPPGCYDAVFCRNLLIYFDLETQIRALKTLGHLLARDGLLFVAPSESGLVLRHGFSPAGMDQTPAFCKTGEPEEKKIPSTVRDRPKAPFAAPPRTKVAPAVSAQPVSVSVRAAASPAASLVEAVRLADEGRFAEVSAICHDVIDRHGASADAYFLLALVSDASNRLQEAVGHYRKALYLEPRHQDALTHFSLLASRMGDAATATALRQRALRLDVDSAAK